MGLACSKRPRDGSSGSGIADGERKMQRNVRPRVRRQPKVLLGPVIGKVEANRANVLLEVDDLVTVEITATPKKGKAKAEPKSFLKEMLAEEPVVFELEGLEDDTLYDITVKSKPDNIKLETRDAVVRTTKKPGKITTCHILVCSCNRPKRLGKAKNPWLEIARLCKKGNIELVLHLGDQVYLEDWHDKAEARCKEADRTRSQADRLAHETAARKIMQQAYRFTWTFEGTGDALAHASHLMQWSDHDVANDFTIWRTREGRQGYRPSLIRVGMWLFRLYQVRLMEPKCEVDPAELEKREEVEESKSHLHGPFGFFMIDQRGPRITARGLQRPDEPLLSKTQRKELQKFLKNRMNCLILSAEIPPVGDRPEKLQKDVKENYELQFLKDHWGYRPTDLAELLDLCFTWKAAEKDREVIILAGDIHVSHESLIRDNKTGQSIRQFVTSPITNRPADFFPPVGEEIKLDDRFSFEHKEPMLNKRTFLELMLEIKPDGTIDVEKKFHPFDPPRQA